MTTSREIIRLYESTLLSPTQVAERFSMAEGTLANWRSAGIGPRFVKTGGRVRYRESAIESWLDARSGGGAA